MIEATLGYKYELFPTDEQAKALEHQMFIYNQTYNICLNLQQENLEFNKKLAKAMRVWLKSVELDNAVKNVLNDRDLPFKTVVTQQARMNAENALKSALTVNSRGFPRFKNSKLAKQSFNWNNQGYQILNSDNPKFKILKIMKMPIKMRYHRELPTNYKMNYITISKSHNRYFVSFSITFEKSISNNIDFSKAIGIDLNIKEIALSNGILIDTNSKELNKSKYSKTFLKLQRKQSRRVLKSKKTKQKLSRNFKKTQNKLNKIFEKAKNIKNDKYHKITSELTNKFDLIAVEDLKTKNMTKRAKNKNVKQKSGLNRSILNTSFYQFLQLLNYKTRLNGKLFVKVPPHYTSKTCSKCGQIKKDLKLSDRVFECECGYIEHRDTNASKNILDKALKSLGLGISLQTINESLSSSEAVALG
jgi:putative transposase